jgi:hypothetical protein
MNTMGHPRQEVFSDPHPRFAWPDTPALFHKSTPIFGPEYKTPRK